MNRLVLPLAILLITASAPAQTIEIPGFTVPARTVELPVRPQPVPINADTLSAPGALQAYTDQQAKTGRIDLPIGVIRVRQWRLVRYRDCLIRAWGTTIVGTDPSVPTIRQAQTHQLKIEGLKVVSGSEVAWQQEHWPGSGTLRTKLDGVRIERAGYIKEGRGGVGLALARRSGELTCADVDISFCEFRGFDRGVQLNGRQAVQVNVHDTTEFAFCNAAVRVNAGGHVRLCEVSIIGAKTVCECGPGAGGSSLQPTVTMRDVYIDDAGSPTRLLDAPKVNRRGQFVARIDGVKCNVPNGKGEGFDLIVMPSGHRNARCEVRGLTKTGRANTEPVQAEPETTQGD